MALFDDATFAPQSYQGSGGLLGTLMAMLQANPKAGGFPALQPQQDQAQLPVNAQPTQGVAPQQPQPYGFVNSPAYMGEGSTGPSQPGGRNPIMGQQPMMDGQLPMNSQPTQGQLLPGGSGGGMGGFMSALMPGRAMAMLQLQQAQSASQAPQATYAALRQSGVPDAVARAAALNPEILKTVAGNYFDTKPQFGVIGQNQMGVNQYGFINPASRTVTPAAPGGAQASANGAASGGIDPTLTGDEFLAAIAADPQLGPGKAAMVKGVAEGRIPYPTGFQMKTPFGQWLTSAVGQYEPGLDATTIGRRRTFNTQLGSASPSSVGGQKTLMGTALGHLGELADAAADLGNVDTPVAMLGQGVNLAKNLTTTQSAKANKLNETVDRFAGEVGKLYSGAQGGGVHERDQTRSRFGSYKTSAELAAGLEASRDLIKSKLDALEGQQDEIFGKDSKSRIDFLGEKGKAALEKIDKAIAKLKGTATAEEIKGAPKVGTVQQGYRFKGGNPADKNNWERVQ